MRSRTRILFIAALLVVGLLGPVVGRPDAQTPTAEALTIQELYAPRLSFHSDEAHFPMSSHTFVNNGDLKWSHDGGCADHMVDSSIYEPDMRGSYRHYESNDWCRHTSTLWRSSDPVRPWGDGGPSGNEGMFINLDNAYRDGQGLGGDEPVYVRLMPGKSLHYFFNYGDSFIKYVPGSHHEGDWEHFAIRLNEANEPVEAQYFYHHDSCTLPWADVPKHQGQPVLWIARDSHGSYPPGASTPWYDSIEAGAVWDTRVNVDDIPSLAWYGYAGGWGEVGNTTNTTGPWGPNPHRTEPGFATPLCELSGTTATSTTTQSGTAGAPEESIAQRPARPSSWEDQSVAETEHQRLVTQAPAQGSGNRVVAVSEDGTEDTVGLGVSGIALADTAGSVAAWTEHRAGSARLVAYDSAKAEVVSTLAVDPSMNVYAVNGTEVVVADGEDSYLWDLSRPSQLAPLLSGRLVTDLTDEYMFATDFHDAALLRRDGGTVATYGGAVEGAFDPTGRLLAMRSGRQVTVRWLSSGVEVDVPNRPDALRWGGDPHGVASTAFGQVAANSA